MMASGCNVKSAEDQTYKHHTRAVSHMGFIGMIASREQDKQSLKRKRIFVGVCTFLFFFPCRAVSDAIGCDLGDEDCIRTLGLWPGQVESKEGAVMQTMKSKEDVYDTFKRASVQLGDLVPDDPKVLSMYT